MATTNTPTVISISGQGNMAGWSASYATMANGDTGVKSHFPDFSDRSVQVVGTFGAGGTLLVEGSNDGGVNWATLNDPNGNALSITSAGVKAITEATIDIRPRVSAGDGSTSLTTTFFFRKTGQP